jgi:hypothetical protein
MKTSIVSLALLAAALIGLPAGPVGAATRVFVSATGSDSNPCTVARPCRNFQQAHNTVAAGGEIDVLDPADYGLVTITKAISIEGHGYAGITSNGSGDVITINAGASDAVNLRGLLIDGVGQGFSGVRVNSVGSLTVQDTLIRNFLNDGDGINFIPNPTGTVRLYITHTRIFDNQGEGININAGGSGTVLAVLNRVEINNVGFNVGFNNGL